MTKVNAGLNCSAGWWFYFTTNSGLEIASGDYKTKTSAKRAAKRFAKKHNFEITKWGEK